MRAGRKIVVVRILLEVHEKWFRSRSASRKLPYLVVGAVLMSQMKCKARHPPGDEIYRKDSVSVFEVDGRKNKVSLAANIRTRLLLFAVSV